MIFSVLALSFNLFQENSIEQFFFIFAKDIDFCYVEFYSKPQVFACGISIKSV